MGTLMIPICWFKTFNVGNFCVKLLKEAQNPKRPKPQTHIMSCLVSYLVDSVSDPEPSKLFAHNLYLSVLFEIAIDSIKYSDLEINH